MAARAAFIRCILHDDILPRWISPHMSHGLQVRSQQTSNAVA
jgi:hypothetical protein